MVPKWVAASITRLEEIRTNKILQITENLVNASIHSNNQITMTKRKLMSHKRCDQRPTKTSNDKSQQPNKQVWQKHKIWSNKRSELSIPRPRDKTSWYMLQWIHETSKKTHHSALAGFKRKHSSNISGCIEPKMIQKINDKQLALKKNLWTQTKSLQTLYPF